MRAAAVAAIMLRLALAFALVASAAVGHEPDAEAADSCIRYWGEVRYGALAYNHIVHIANSCTADAECVVSTDVNPDEQRVTVGGKSEVLVTTFLGSPARTFKPKVACSMH
jgi:hypothetical protein